MNALYTSRDCCYMGSLILISFSLWNCVQKICLCSILVFVCNLLFCKSFMYRTD
uniref:Uncharacterized protein n=1 Tax=Arundo donax TaxID=35708 RepID=A0A0A9EX81_ARUDO